MRHALRASRFVAAFARVSGLALANVAIAGPYTRPQVLMPGEIAAPGTPTGKTGSPRAQTVGVPFTITVRACDSGWNAVPSVTDAIQALSSDQTATLPSVTQLVSGTRTLQVTFSAAGTFTVYAPDQTDGTIPDGASAATPTFVLQGFTLSNLPQKNQNAGVPLNMTIRAVDPAGNLVSGFNGDVTLQDVTRYGPGRTSPATVTFTNGTWSGGVTMYRADETSINRGNVNLTAFLPAAPAKNGTRDPFTVHPGGFSRIQAVVPGQTPLPGSISGVTGTPSAQSAGTAFPVEAWAADAWFSPVGGVGDVVHLGSDDPLAQLAPDTSLVNGVATMNVRLARGGCDLSSVADVTSPSKQGNGSLVSSGGYLALIEAHGTSETMHVIRRKIALVR